MRCNSFRWLSISLTILLLFSLGVPLGQAESGDDDNTGYEPENPGVKEEQTDEGDLGMVVTAHPLASKVGADVLKRGGNAVDAAVAVQLALNVVEPMMSGIGGGGFLMYYDATEEEVSIINSRERAPQGATPDMFIDKSDIVTGEGQFLLGANELNNDGGGQFHIGEIIVYDLDRSSSEDYALYDDFGGEEGSAWSSEKYDLLERGTTFTLSQDGGRITFGPPVGSNRTSFGRITPKMEKLENSELLIRFRTDDPGDDRRLRLWLRADEYRPGSTFAKNGYGIEINTNTNEIKLIQSKDSKSSTLSTISHQRTTDWQWLRFRVDEDELKVRLWKDGTEEPAHWDVEAVAGRVMPFSERVQSGRSVGVPGTLKGLEAALDQWGTMALEELIQPAIEMAEEGIEVNWVLANAIANNKGKLARSAAKDVFLPDGQPLEEGDLLVQKDLAKTLRLISKHGTDVFYNGEIGEALAQVVQQYDGSMTLDDLKRYDVTYDTPVWGDYKGYDIASMPPPSSGGLTMLQLLKMFEQLDLTQYDVRSVEKYHYMTEAMHLAYADRGAYMGDPEYVDVPKEGLLHPDYVKKRVEAIDPNRANPNVKPGNPWDYQDTGEPERMVEQGNDKVDGETTHFTVADRWGNLVSYTTTIEQLFGSGIMVPGYGIMLNNELTDFDAIPGGANEVQPNKRPLSSMTPTIVFKDDEPFMTVGSPGGATIITSVMQTIVNVIGYGMELKEAIEEPRIYSNQYPSIRWEYGIPDNVRQQLEQMGHAWESHPREIGNVNSILVDHEAGLYIGAADSTREGTAIGWSSEEINVQRMITLIERFEDEGEITTREAARLLKIHLTAVGHYEDEGLMEKAVKHMESFKLLLDHQHEKGWMSEKAYRILYADADVLLKRWQ